MQQQQRNWGNGNDEKVSYPSISNSIGYSNANVNMNQMNMQPNMNQRGYNQMNQQQQNYPSQPQNLGFFSYGQKTKSKPPKPKIRPPKQSSLNFQQQPQNMGMFSYGQAPKQNTSNTNMNMGMGMGMGMEDNSMDVPDESEVMGTSNNEKQEDKSLEKVSEGMGNGNDRVMDIQKQREPVKQMDEAIDFLNPFVVKPQTHKFEVMSGGRVLCCALNNEKMWTKTGAMISYIGNARFSKKDIFDGLKMIGEAILKQKMDLMKCNAKGNCQVFLSGDGRKIIPFFLKKDESIVIDRDNLLAFESSVRYNHSFSFGKILQGGLFACKVRGPGFVAITSKFDPIVIPIQKGVKIRTDFKNTLFWSGNLTPNIITDIKLKSLFGAKSNEEFQMGFSSNKKGFVGISPVNIKKETKKKEEVEKDKK